MTLTDVLMVNANAERSRSRPRTFLRDVNLSGTLTISDKLFVQRQSHAVFCRGQ